MRISRSAYTSLPLLVLAACVDASTPQSSDDPIGRTSEPIVSTTNTSPTYYTQTTIPTITAHGSFTGTTVLGITSASGTYTNGVDLLAGPSSNNESSWSATLPLSELTAPNFPTYMTQAASQANADSTVSTGPIQSIFNLWSDVLGGTPTFTGPASQFYGYTPVRGQWVREPFGLTRTATQYSDPPQLVEQRDRGARLYCAARNAQRQQSPATTTMGSQAAFSVSILGHQIDFLVTEPTAVLGAPVPASGSTWQSGGPQRFVGTSADGAQAFEIPLQFGTRFTPVRGLGLPGLSEVRYPVVLTSGDTEAITYENQSGIGWYSAEDVTVSHADTIRSEGAGASISNQFPLFTIGPVTINFGLGLSMNVGTPTNPDQRLLQVPVSPSTGFSTNTRSGRLWNNTTIGYHDGDWFDSWRNNLFVVEPDGASNSFWQITQSGTAGIRAMQDDDHHFVGANSVALNAGLSGTLGIDFGPIDVGLTVGGSVTATATQQHIVQDAVIGEQIPATTQFTPATALNVRPRTTANATFNGIQVTLNLTLDLLFGTINWSEQLLDVGAFTIASYDSETTHAWPESSSLRIGTWSPLGNSMKQPQVYSHLPQGGDFLSFPSESVDACLADTTANPPPPPPCAAQPAGGSTPAANLCALVPLDRTSGCSNIPAWAAAVSLNSSTLQATENLVTFMCSPVEQQLPNFVSRITNSTADLATLGSLVQACGNAAESSGATAAATTAWLTGLVEYSACDQNANPLAPSSIVSGPANPSLPPTVSTGGSCN